MSKQLCRLNPNNTLKHKDPCTCHRCQHFVDDNCPEESGCASCRGTKKLLLGIAACKSVVPIQGFIKRFHKEEDGVSYFTTLPIGSCCVCDELVKGKDKEFSEDQEQHPGILGDVHPECYKKACEEEPDLPWKDPISGEVDYQGMGEALGIWPATEEDFWHEEEEYY